MKNNMKVVKKLLVFFICAILVIPSMTVNAAYSTGKYKVMHPKGVNVRSKASSTGKLLGSASPGITFTVDKVSGEWGHTKSIKTTSGTKEGYVNLKYCTAAKPNSGSGSGSGSSTSTKTTNTSTTSKYDAQSALNYAARNWNSGQGLCAEFISDCLSAGGLKFKKQTRVGDLYSELKSIKGTSVSTLTIESNGRILRSKNPSIEPGDIIVQKCDLETDGKPWSHVVIVSSFDSKGQVRVYAHNRAKNNEVFNFIHCSGKSNASNKTTTCYLMKFS